MTKAVFFSLTVVTLTIVIGLLMLDFRIGQALGGALTFISACGALSELVRGCEDKQGQAGMFTFFLIVGLVIFFTT